MNRARLPSSFRDPSGFIFSDEGEIFRQVNHPYSEHYDLLMGSGLYQDLAGCGLLVEHEEVATPSIDAYRILRPEPIPFISYPYEWSFSQLKHAALATLDVQKRALAYGMTLKDASAYNIQFLRGRPVLMDLLSFEKYREGEPWIAYRQFCQHFLAPLALMSYKNVGLGQLSKIHIDGVPLDLARSLLPTRTRFKPGLLVHVHMHAAMQGKFSDKTDAKSHRKRSFGVRALQGLIDSLESSISKLSWRPGGTEWADYEENESYSREALNHKTRIVAAYLQEVKPNSVWDMGGNTGHFSRLASDIAIPTISFDKDPGAVEKNYLSTVARKETNLLPLVLDLTNPSPLIGWANLERMDLVSRGPTDMLLALALIHHLAISDNLPLGMIADFFSRLCQWALVEFVPKSDRQVARLLATREDIFPNYTQDAFQREFSKHFEVKSAQPMAGSERSIYLLKKR